MSQSVLIIDDEEDIRRLVSDILGDEGYETYTAADGASAMETIKVRRPSLVILDIWLNDSRFDGIELLDIIKSDHPLAPVIMISGHGTIETAVKSIQKGAYDFVEKPFTAERLLLVVKRALEASRLVRENIELRDRVGEDEFVGESSAATQLRSTIETVAPTKSRVFISGDDGAGKKTVARLLHKHSQKSAGPFVSLNCRKASPQTIEEELFGREGRAQSPLHPSKTGCFEMAYGGTLFLENVDCLPLEVQAKLVKALHTEMIRRVDSSQAIPVDARIISSSAADMDVLISSKRFREDLYNRLNVVSVKIPSLSNRREDIPALAEGFKNKFQTEKGKHAATFSEQVILKLKAHDWPGNVRQLKNVVEWALITSSNDPGEKIGVEAFPLDMSEINVEEPPKVDNEDVLNFQLREAREIFERNYLSSQVNRFGGNISRTSEFVGMERSALHRKLRALGLSSEKAESRKKNNA